MLMDMTWDEAFDLMREPEVIEADDIDPVDGGDPDRPLTDEEVFDLWIHDPNRFRDWDYDDDDFDSMQHQIEKGNV